MEVSVHEIELGRLRERIAELERTVDDYRR